MSWSIKLGVSLVIVIILLRSDFPAALPIPPRHRSPPASDPTEVVLVSNIDTALIVHVKSKDDDLGFHTLLDGESWQFSFHPNFFGSTLFYGSFQWADQFYYFDVYKESRDVQFRKIYWSVTRTGLCRLVGTDKECISWNT